MAAYDSPQTCVFCQFSDVSVVVYQDRRCYAVISRRPINRYHVLLIPVEQYERFSELPDELAAHMAVVAKRLSGVVAHVSRADAVTHLSDDDITGIGINLVAHYKLHIIPRFRHDKVRIEWDRWPAVDDEARVAYAQTVRDSLNGGKAG